MSQVIISAINFCIRPVADFEEFAQHAGTLLDRCEGSDLVLLPELFTLELFTTEDDWAELPMGEFTRVARYTEEYRQFFSDEARRRNQHIAAGTHLERRRDGYYNVAYLFGPDGERYEHEKTHIFPAESDWSTLEGESLAPIELPFATVGFNVCYEAEIPECASTLSNQGAEIILSPSYTFTEYGFWRVRHCAHARAIENQVYFVHCSTGGAGIGSIPPGWARSSVLSPCDEPWNPTGVIAQAGENVEEIATGSVDLEVLHRNRQGGAATTFRDRRRRAGIYRAWSAND